MPTKLEILQGRVINTYLANTHLPAFEHQVFFVDGVMQPAYSWLWDNAGKLSSGERLVFYVSKEIWTWLPEVKIYTLMDLSLELVELTLSLYLAWKGGEAELSNWIVKNGG